MTIADILRIKGNQTISIRPDAPLDDAIQTLVIHRVGALLVIDEDENLVGIITERDILREITQHWQTMQQTMVSAIMSRDIIIGLMDDSLDYVMDLMTERRIRHLPIMQEGKLAGILSIGDVVKAKAHLGEIETRHLKDYIMGKYPG